MARQSFTSISKVAFYCSLHNGVVCSACVHLFVECSPEILLRKINIICVYCNGNGNRRRRRRRCRRTESTATCLDLAERQNELKQRLAIQSSHSILNQLLLPIKLYIYSVFFYTSAVRRLYLDKQLMLTCALANCMCVWACVCVVAFSIVRTGFTAIHSPIDRLSSVFFNLNARRRH